MAGSCNTIQKDGFALALLAWQVTSGDLEFQMFRYLMQKVTNENQEIPMLSSHNPPHARRNFEPTPSNSYILSFEIFCIIALKLNYIILMCLFQ